VADRFDRRGEARAEGRKIKRTRALVDLDRIAAAHGDVRLCFAVEVGEFASSAAPAARTSRDFDGLETTRPDIGGDEAARERVFFSGEKF